MVGSGAQYVFWVFWCLLIVGASLSSFGLWRSAVRFRSWKWATTELEGEIVLGDKALQPHQLVSVQLDDDREGNASQLCGQIIEIRGQTITLTLDPPLADPLPLNEPDAQQLPWIGSYILVTVTGDGALLRFRARVGDIREQTSKAGQRLLTVPRPIWLARIQRRHHVRVPVSLPATLERAVGFSGESDRLFPAKLIHLDNHLPMHAEILDLSGGGLRANVGRVMGAEDAAQLVEAFGPGTVLRIRLPLPALSDSALLARVRACERVAARGGLGVRVACQFLPMGTSEQEMLIHHIFRAQQGHS